MIQYVKGDVTRPISPSPQNSHHQNIIHICNDYGGWGRGVVLAISKRWKQPERVYRAHGPHYELGSIQAVTVAKEGLNVLRVVNCVAQHGDSSPGNPACDLEALRRCLIQVSFSLTGTFHMPRIGSGLGGRDWDEDILPVIESVMERRRVTVYDLE